MSRGPRIAAATAGVLCANALPHLATAVTGRRMLTPLAGRDSPAPVNALWGAMNLAGGLLLLRVGLSSTERTGPVPEAFGIGVAGFAVWAVAGERVLGFNAPQDPR
jgi:hypothetical protein